MSFVQISALVCLVIFCGLGILKALRGLMLRAADPQADHAPFSGFGSIILGLFLFLVLWLGFSFTEPPVKFMRALRDGRDREAYGLLTSSLQADFDGFMEFSEWADDVRPQQWFFNSSCSGFSEGRSDGTTRLQSGTRTYVSVHVIREEKQWRIEGIQYWDLEPSYWVGTSSGLDCSD